jgi:hypothetical protein
MCGVDVKSMVVKGTQKNLPPNKNRCGGVGRAFSADKVPGFHMVNIINDTRSFFDSSEFQRISIIAQLILAR